MALKKSGELVSTAHSGRGNAYQLSKSKPTAKKKSKGKTKSKSKPKG